MRAMKQSAALVPILQYVVCESTRSLILVLSVLGSVGICTIAIVLYLNAATLKKSLIGTTSFPPMTDWLVYT
jgi:hypothetical protein